MGKLIAIFGACVVAAGGGAYALTASNLPGGSADGSCCTVAKTDCCPTGSCCPDGPCCVAGATAKVKAKSADCCPTGACCPDGPCCVAGAAVAKK